MRRLIDRLPFTLWLFLAWMTVGAATALEALADGVPQELQLDVIINDIPAKTIGAFVLTSDGRIGSTPRELDEIGIPVPSAAGRDEVILLETIPGLTYSYEAPTQRIRLMVDATHLKTKSYGSPKGDRETVRPRSDWGTALSYDVYTSTQTSNSFRRFAAPSNSLELRSRSFSPYGYIEQSGLIRSTGFADSQAIRLDSAYHYSDPDTLISYTAGDLIGGSLSWTRPIRIGGVQARSNFGLRPDLITSPMLSLGGTAQVPSTVDVYLNNIKTLSQPVDQGPFQLTNIPALSGNGQAQIVIRDATGQETRSSTPFYSSPKLLAADLMSWSIETGAPRLAYGSTGDGYGSDYVAALTARRGIFQWLTLESHVEGARGLLNGGLGVVASVGAMGVATGALAASRSDIGSGFQASAGYQTTVLGVTLGASTQRAFKSFDDLAGFTARRAPTQALVATDAFSLSRLFATYGVPRALDSLNVSAPVAFDRTASIGFGLVRSVDSSGVRSTIVETSYSKILGNDMTFSASAFRSFAATPNTGVFVALSFRLGHDASVSASSNQGKVTARVDYAKQLGPETGSFGWHVTDSEGATSSRAAQVSYRSPVGTVEATAFNAMGADMGSLQLRGTISSIDGHVFTSDSINDSFLLVKTDKPGVPVFQDNRKVGVTDASGNLLLPQMPSYVQSKISIDPTDMPVDAEINQTARAINPADHSGQVITFSVGSVTNAALVTFVRADGKEVPAGSRGKLSNGQVFVVGYDGQAYIKGLSSGNDATIDLDAGSCAAHFVFTPQPGEQVKIAPVACR